MNKTIILLMVFFTLKVISKTTFSIKNSKLETYNIDKNEISVSGISSGGYMATQFQIAFSKYLKGASAIASGPYMCAENNMNTALTRCMSFPFSMPPPSTFINYAKNYERRNEIDEISNLNNHKIYLYYGTSDTTVVPGVSQALVSFFREILNERSFKENVIVKNLPSEHAMITDRFGNPCNVKRSPFINNCNFSLAGELLKHIHGNLNDRKSAIRSNMIEFSQSEFSQTVTLARNGFVYVPTACKDKTQKCKLHVVFHGCQQNYATLNDIFITNSGYNEWAESNNFIILYPQTVATTFPLNPNGCWDWWGITSSDYGNKKGFHMDAVWKMIRRISGI